MLKQGGVGMVDDIFYTAEGLCGGRESKIRQSVIIEHKSVNICSK